MRSRRATGAVALLARDGYANVERLLHAEHDVLQRESHRRFDVGTGRGTGGAARAATPEDVAAEERVEQVVETELVAEPARARAGTGTGTGSSTFRAEHVVTTPALGVA